MHQIASFFFGRVCPRIAFAAQCDTSKIIQRFLVFKYQKKEFRISMYAEYRDDGKTTISVKKCLKFDCPLAFINNKGVLQQNMIFVFFVLGSIPCLSIGWHLDSHVGSCSCYILT